MARLVATILLPLISISTGAQAADPSGSPWHANEKIHHSRNFHISDQASDSKAGKAWGSRIIAGQQLMPNGMLGIGMFGHKAEKGPHSAATARDYALPKQRKAAVGFSLKF